MQTRPCQLTGHKPSAASPIDVKLHFNLWYHASWNWPNAWQVVFLPFLPRVIIKKASKPTRAYFVTSFASLHFVTQRNNLSWLAAVLKLFSQFIPLMWRFSAYQKNFIPMHRTQTDKNCHSIFRYKGAAIANHWLQIDCRLSYQYLNDSRLYDGITRASVNIIDEGTFHERIQTVSHANRSDETNVFRKIVLEKILW